MTVSSQEVISVRLKRTDPADATVLYFGNWGETTDQTGQPRWRSNTQFNTCVLAFKGSVVRWLGLKGPDHGFAEVFLDWASAGIVDTYAPVELGSQVLFEKIGLDEERFHTVSIVVRQERNQAATDSYQGIDGFESGGPVDYPEILRQVSTAELSAGRSAAARAPTRLCIRAHAVAKV